MCLRATCNGPDGVDPPPTIHPAPQRDVGTAGESTGIAPRRIRKARRSPKILMPANLNTSEWELALHTHCRRPLESQCFGMEVMNLI